MLKPQEIDMLQIQQIDTITALKSDVEASRAAGKDFIGVALTNLSTHEFTDDELGEFLNEVERDARMINVVLKSGSASSSYSFELLQETRFNEMHCISAGEVHQKDERFIINLLANAFKASATKGRRLTKYFEKNLTQLGAVPLLKATQKDPVMSKILHPAMSRTIM